MMFDKLVCEGHIVWSCELAFAPACLRFAVVDIHMRGGTHMPLCACVRTPVHVCRSVCFCACVVACACAATCAAANARAYDARCHRCADIWLRVGTRLCLHVVARIYANTVRTQAYKNVYSCDQVDMLAKQMYFYARVHACMHACIYAMSARVYRRVTWISCCAKAR